MISPLQEEVARRLTRYKRQIKCTFRRSHGQTLPVFVMGYGRSGTTMMLNTFALDERFEIFRENDPRIARDFMLVYEKIGQAISGSKAEVLVMKPILNSFNTSRILADYKNSKIIWMLRDYRDVTASAVKRFGSTVGDYLKAQVETGSGDNWLAHGIPHETLTYLRTMKSTSFTDYDWMALVWWSVNRTILLDQLHKCDRFQLLRYENLVKDTENVLAELFEFLGLEYKKDLGKYIHDMSVGKGSRIQLQTAVQEMCDKLTEEISVSCQGIG
jgi:hypothetical protein